MDPYTNAGISTVQVGSGIIGSSSSGVSIILASGDGTHFPGSDGRSFSVVVAKDGVAKFPNYEIVKVTRSTDTLTVVSAGRAQESTSALTTIAAGWYVYGAVTKGLLDSLALGRRQLAFNGRTVKDELFPISMCNNTATLTSQLIYFGLVGALNGDQLANVCVDINAVGTGAQPTGIFVGAYSLAGAKLAESANLKASTKFTAATGPQELPLTSFSAVSGYTNSSGLFIADTAFYVCILLNGTYTSLLLGRFASNAETFKALGSGAILVGNQAGQTSLPSSASIVVSSASNIWLGWN